MGNSVSCFDPVREHPPYSWPKDHPERAAAIAELKRKRRNQKIVGTQGNAHTVSTAPATATATAAAAAVTAPVVAAAADAAAATTTDKAQVDASPVKPPADLQEHPVEQVYESKEDRSADVQPQPIAAATAAAAADADADVEAEAVADVVAEAEETAEEMAEETEEQADDDDLEHDPAIRPPVPTPAEEARDLLDKDLDTPVHPDPNDDHPADRILPDAPEASVEHPSAPLADDRVDPAAAAADLDPEPIVPVVVPLPADDHRNDDPEEDDLDKPADDAHPPAAEPAVQQEDTFSEEPDLDDLDEPVATSMPLTPRDPGAGDTSADAPVTEVVPEVPPTTIDSRRAMFERSEPDELPEVKELKRDVLDPVTGDFLTLNEYRQRQQERARGVVKEKIENFEAVDEQVAKEKAEFAAIEAIRHEVSEKTEWKFKTEGGSAHASPVRGKPSLGSLDVSPPPMEGDIGDTSRTIAKEANISVDTSPIVPDVAEAVHESVAVPTATAVDDTPVIDAPAVEEVTAVPDFPATMPETVPAVPAMVPKFPTLSAEPKVPVAAVTDPISKVTVEAPETITAVPDVPVDISDLHDASVAKAVEEIEDEDEEDLPTPVPA